MAEARGGSSGQDGRIAGLDTSVAHPARVYDYWLGGKDNFAADREAAERVLAAAPGLRYRVRANRAFLGRATRYLAAEAGVRQFLDIGTGIPTGDNTHEVAQRAAPDSRVVYVDNDPIVLLHAQALLRSTPEGATDYLQADLRDPATILDRAAGLLDFGQPVALMLLGVLHLIQDAEDPWGIVARLMAALPAGSYLTISHPAIDIHHTQANAQRVYNERVATPQTLRTREQVARFFTGLELVEPGLVQVHQWRPDPGDFAPEGTVSAHGGVARKAGSSGPPGGAAWYSRPSGPWRLPGQCLCGPLDDRVEVVARARAVERSAPVGQQLAHQRHALSRDRALPGEGTGQLVQLRCGTGDPVAAERDMRLTRGASRPRRGQEPRACLRGHRRRQHPPQARGQATAVPDGGQDHGPCGQDRALLRPDAARQPPVQPRCQAAG